MPEYRAEARTQIASSQRFAKGNAFALTDKRISSRKWQRPFPTANHCKQCFLLFCLFRVILFLRSHCKPDASPSSRPQIMNPGHNQTLQPCQAINLVVVEKAPKRPELWFTREEIKRNKKARFAQLQESQSHAQSRAGKEGKETKEPQQGSFSLNT